MNSSASTRRPVVITGIGVISPIGTEVDKFWTNLSQGVSGVVRIPPDDPNHRAGEIGGLVANFTDETAKKEFLRAHRKSIKVMCREIQLGVASAAKAMEHSGLDLDAIDHQRLGIDFGANLMLSPPSVLKDACWACVGEAGEVHASPWGALGLQNMEPLWLLKYLPNMPACHIGIHADARGPNNSITLDEASGNLALGEAYRVIDRNHADIMIAGTTGTRLHPVQALHSQMWHTLADTPEDPALRCRPFDANRTGQVVGEGACSFILEEESHARSRGANILATVIGAGASCVGKRDGSVDLRQAMVNAIRAAFRDAGVAPDQIGHINANASGEPEADAAEAQAILETFGDAAAKVPVTAIKSFVGNAGSGCGTIELAASICGLAHGVIPHTLNFATPDPKCPLDVVHGEPRAAQNKVFLKISCTSLGQASALVVKCD